MLERHRRLRFEPGERASYWNLGYLVLGEVISRIAKKRRSTTRCAGMSSIPSA
jgi:CubicO group peptidase (beta-lactamase class C family)